MNNEHNIVIFLSVHPNSNIKEIADGIDLPKRRARYYIRGLVEKGRIEKTPDFADLRTYRYSAANVPVGQEC